MMPEWSTLPPEAMGTSRHMLFLRARSGFMVLYQLGSVLIYLAHVTTKGYVDVPGLNCHLRHGANLTLAPFTCRSDTDDKVWVSIPRGHWVS